MSEPSQRPAIASSPLSVILFAQGLSTESADGLQAWQEYLLNTLRRPHEIFLIQQTHPEAAPPDVGTLRTFPYEHSTGFRAALNDAIRAAQFPLIAFSTADKQYQPADLARLLALIDKVDLVAAYRAGGQAPFWRVLLDTALTIFGIVILGIPAQKRVSWLGAAGWHRRWVARWLFGLRFADPECPFRVARRSILEGLPIQSGGPFVQIEILAKANHMGALFAEELVAWSPPANTENSAISFSHDARLVFRNPEFPRGVRPTP